MYMMHEVPEPLDTASFAAFATIEVILLVHCMSILG